VYNVTATFYNVEAAVQLSLRLESELGLLVESVATLQAGIFNWRNLVEVFCKALWRKEYSTYRHSNRYAVTK